MEELGPGLYEALITEGLKAQLDALADRVPSRVRDLRAAEAPDRIAWHLSKQLESALADVGDSERVGVGLTVARALLNRLGELLTIDPMAVPADPATVLHAVMRRLPDGRPEEIDEPLDSCGELVPSHAMAIDQLIGRHRSEATARSAPEAGC